MSLRHDVAPTDVATIPLISDDAFALADHVITFLRPEADRSQVVVEVRDAHGNLLARSVVETDETSQSVADGLLQAAHLERCSDFITDPLGKRRVRRVASVGPTIDATISRYERDRSSAPQMAI